MSVSERVSKRVKDRESMCVRERQIGTERERERERGERERERGERERERERERESKSRRAKHKLFNQIIFLEARKNLIRTLSDSDPSI